MAKVLLQGEVKKFGSVTAVDDLTIEINDREFVTLVGRWAAARPPPYA